MLTVQPPFILDYFRAKTKGLSNDKLFRSFFLSWEDGLWHLLANYQVQHGSVILLPEFYCGNVVEHMEEHGLKAEYYPVSSKLVTETREFVSSIKKYQPDIVIVFHPMGISNRLMEKVDEWSKYLLPTAMIIEDCVHKILDEDKINLLNERHFLMDSLRKVVPIQGSNLYSAVQLPRVELTQSLQTIFYRLRVLYYWTSMQIWLLLAYYSQTTKQSLLASQRVDYAMTKGYDLIGSTKVGSPGFRVMDYLSRRIPTLRIERCKERQTKQYLIALQPLLMSGDYWLPSMEPADYRYLRGFPLIMNIEVAKQFTSHMSANGILVDIALDDSLWSKKQKIIYLPMGLHVKKEHVEEIASVLRAMILDTK